MRPLSIGSLKYSSSVYIHFIVSKAKVGNSFGVCPVARKFISPKAQKFEGALVRKLTCPKVLVFIFYFADIIIYW